MEAGAATLPRSYYIKTGTSPERRFENLPRYRTTTTQNKVYNITTDPLGYAKKFTDPLSMEKFLIKKGYIGYEAPGGGMGVGQWHPFAIFKPLKAGRVREYSIGISPFTKGAKNIDKLNAAFESDARKLLEIPNVTFVDYKNARGVYGKTSEPSPLFTLEYGGDYNTLRNGIAQLSSKYKQESSVISKLALSGEPGAVESAVFRMGKNLSRQQEAYLTRLANVHGVGIKIADDMAIIHNISEFKKMSADEFKHAATDISNKLNSKKLSHEFNLSDYLHDVIWGK